MTSMGLCTENTVTAFMLIMYLNQSLQLGSRLVLLLSGTLSAGSTVAHRLNVSTLAAIVAQGLTKLAL